jgi:hypothetical protein
MTSQRGGVKETKGTHACCISTFEKNLVRTRKLCNDQDPRPKHATQPRWSEVVKGVDLITDVRMHGRRQILKWSGGRPEAYRAHI